jgi:putative (di)nucleoside polyphosphate hydrolase
VIDIKGFRSGVVIVLVNDQQQLFMARRIGQQDAWQFPQGGLHEGETPREAMYRELNEEIGLLPDHVEIIAESKDWLKYHLPKNMIRYYSKPLCIGQRQRWFLLRMKTTDNDIDFNVTDSPEFDMFRWVDYWYPTTKVISFKKRVYQKALNEFESKLK